MTRIEKTQINISAFITLSSILKNVQSDKIIEIVNDGGSVILRDKEEHEKENLSIDLTFLAELFKAMVTGVPGPVILTGEAEQYLRNCSYACYYYRNESERRGLFDHFDLFHKIHFSNVETSNLDEDIVLQFCGLFRINPENVILFDKCNANCNSTIKLPEKKVFNQIFDSMQIDGDTKHYSLTVESYPLEMNESLDSLFAIKDLLSCRWIDTKIIPEYNLFSIQRDQELSYSFKTVTGMEFIITFRYDKLKVEMKKSSA